MEKHVPSFPSMIIHLTRSIIRNYWYSGLTSLLGMGILVVDEPVDGGLQVSLHILLLFVSEFKQEIGIAVVLLNV